MRDARATFPERLNQSGRIDFEIWTNLVGSIFGFRSYAHRLRNLFGTYGPIWDDCFCDLDLLGRIDFQISKHLRNICATLAERLNQSGRIEIEVGTNLAGLILRPDPICSG